MPNFSTGYANAALNASGFQEQFPATAVIEERTGAAPGPDAAAGGTLIRSYTLAASPWNAPASKGTSNAALLSAAAVAGGTVGHVRIRRAGDAGGANTTDVRAELTAAQWATQVALTSSTITAGVAAITSGAVHGLSVGDKVLISGHSGTTGSLNGVQTVTAVGSTTAFSFATAATGAGTGGFTQRGTAEYNIDNSVVAFGQTGNIAAGALVVTHP